MGKRKPVTMADIEAAWQKLEAARSRRDELGAQIYRLSEKIDRLRAEHRELANHYTREQTWE